MSERDAVATGLQATVAVRLGRLALDAALEAAPGETVAVLGPNGAGKTTLLRALAGLVALDAGAVVVDDEVLEDVVAGVHVPTERRPVGIVFQDHLLFPHLSAVDNVAFGPRSRGVPRREARRLALEWLARVGLAEHASARPRALSGGQAQRVALARALAVEPRLLLLDEPLGALDATTRVATRRELRRHLAGHAGVRILVTHDPVEAAALADRLVVLEEGRVVQTGTPDEVRARPRSRYVADLVGVNLVTGRASGTAVDVGGFRLTIATPTDGDVLVVIHPRAVALHAGPPHGTPRNVWAGTVAALDDEGERVRVVVEGPVPIVAEVTPGAVAELGLHEGSGVHVSVKATEIDVFEA